MLQRAPRPLRPAQVVSCGVDWVTCTTPRDWPDDQLLHAGDRLLALAECEGHVPVERSSHGYALMVAGQVVCGLGEQGAYVTLSGRAAADHWHEVTPVAKTVTRLDLQVTVRPTPADPYLSYDHWRQVQAWKRERLRAPQVRWMGQDELWQTLYVGAGASESMLRVYDKGAESEEPEYADCWRYEVQTRKPKATRLARLLRASEDPGASVGAYVSEYARRRGMWPRFDTTVGAPRAAGGKPRGDDQRKLDYLFECIRPIVLGLVERGRGIEAWRMLGLHDELAQLAAAGPLLDPVHDDPNAGGRVAG